MLIMPYLFRSVYWYCVCCAMIMSVIPVNYLKLIKCYVFCFCLFMCFRILFICFRMWACVFSRSFSCIIFQIVSKMLFLYSCMMAYNMLRYQLKCSPTGTGAHLRGYFNGRVRQNILSDSPGRCPDDFGQVAYQPGLSHPTRDKWDHWHHAKLFF